jgi:cation transport ATPase
MNSNTDALVSSATVATLVLGERGTALTLSVALSQQALRIIRQNYAIAVGVNAGGIVVSFLQETRGPQAVGFRVAARLMP